MVLPASVLAWEAKRVTVSFRLAISSRSLPMSAVRLSDADDWASLCEVPGICPAREEDSLRASIEVISWLPCANGTRPCVAEVPAARRPRPTSFAARPASLRNALHRCVSEWCSRAAEGPENPLAPGCDRILDIDQCGSRRPLPPFDRHRIRSKGLGIDTIELRCKTEFCLRLLQLGTDGSLTGRLSYRAPLPTSRVACRARRSCRS